MNRKFFLGLLAFSPIMILSISVAGSIYADTDPSEFWVQIYSLFVALVTLVFIINVPFNRHVENGKKGLWAALILFGNLWVLPFFWWFHVRKSYDSHSPSLSKR